MIGSVLSSSSGLDQATKSLHTSQNRLSTGSRLNSAKDDAAGLAVATRMAAELVSDNQAQRNVYDGISATEAADGGLNQVASSLQRMRELAVQSANGTNSPSDRQALQDEFAQLGQQIDQISSQTQFNGKNLLDGSFSTAIQSGPNAGDTKSLALGDASTNGLGIAALNVSTTQGASNALSSLDQAINTVSSQQSLVGAAQAGLNSAAASLSGTYENLAASKSRIADADFGRESANQTQSSVRQQAALQALSLYHANQSSVLGFLPGAK